MAQSLERALHTIFLSPETQISQLSLFSISDHEDLLRWNGPYPKSVDRLVHEMIADMVAATPEAIAVAAWDGEITYRELDRLSSRLAEMLRAMHKVAPEDIIALCFEKSVWAVVAMLGVLKAGAAFLHLDPKHPPARHQAMMSTTAARLLLCSEHTLDAIAKSVPEYQAMIIGRKMFAAQPDHNQQDTFAPPETLRPTSAAYVICTSGSTGTPKAIVCEHLSLCTSVTAQASAMAITRHSRILQYAAYTFDVSVGDIFTALTQGACVCIPSDWERTHDLAGAINRLEINQACLTSTVASLLNPAEVPGLKKLTLGGEPASQQCIDLWSGRVALKNVYGPAECTVWCVIQPDASSVAVSNIGRAIGARAWIVHPENHNQLMPVGAIGELLMEGPLVARGYLNDPEKTAAVFLEHPPTWMASFGPLPFQSRLYKTGDLAQLGPDGALLFQGRKDTQVKLRGQRIELGEVEYCIHTALPSAETSVAVELVHPRGSAGPLLAAFIPWAEGFDVSLDKQAASNMAYLNARSRFCATVSHIQANLDRTLPPYMMPGLFVPVQRLPLSTSGKLDRKLLREFCTQYSHMFLATGEAKTSTFAVDNTAGSSADYPETVDLAEVTLTQLWGQVLGRNTDTISRTDNFLSLGGDSLAAMRLVNMAARDAQLTLTVANVFKFPVLADQAGLLQPLKETKHMAPFEMMVQKGIPVKDLVDLVAEQCEVSRDQVEDSFPCTPLQEEMMRDSLSHDRTQLGQEVVQLDQNLDLKRFVDAVSRVFRQFPILRTRFVKHSGSLVQVVIREDIDWKRPASLEEYVKADSQEPPALGKHLARWALTQDNTHFILTLHHAIFDGITLGRILGAVYAVYQSIPLPPPSISFATFLAHLEDQNLPLSGDSHRFWRSYLSRNSDPVDPSLFSAKEFRYQPRANSGAQRLVQFKSGEVSMLQHHGLTEATLVRGAWALTLAQRQATSSLSIPPEVIFGTMLTGRNFHLPGVDTLAAPTLTHVPIRIRMYENELSKETARVFLARVQSDATAMIPFEHDGMNRIQSIDDKVKSSCNSIHTLLVIQPIPEGLTSASSTPFPGPIISGPRMDAREMRHFHWYSLLVECTLLPKEGFFVRMSFDDRSHTAEDVESLLDEYSQALHTLAQRLNTEGPYLTHH